MAYPVVESYTSGNINTISANVHTIPLPACNAGDLLVCFISCASETIYNALPIPYYGSSINFARPYNALSSVYNNPPPYGIHYYSNRAVINPDINFNVTHTLFLSNAVGGGSDVLVIGTYLSGYSSEDTVLYGNSEGPTSPQCTGTAFYPYTTKPAYICYRISGAWGGASYWDGALGGVINSTKISTMSGSGTNWNMSMFPSYDDSDTEDYLYLLSAASTHASIATVAPTDWTNLITAAGSALIYNSSSLSSCRYTSTVRTVNPGAFTAPNDDDYSIFGLRIRPLASGPGTIDVIPPTAGGVGTYIQDEGVSVYIPTVDSVAVNPEDMYFGYEGDQCSNPFGTYIEIVSTGAWTASWINDDHFDAGQYSGSTGVTYVAITCRAENTTGLSYIDTLTVVSGGSSDTVTVEQYATGMECS